MAAKRNRWTYLIFVGVTIILGLSSRQFSGYLPYTINLYLGDALWALMVFFMFCFIFRLKGTGWLAAVALLFTFGIEISQLYHAPWIDAIRQTRLGGLVLGYGFLWRDLVAYTIGVAVGAVIDRLINSYLP
ncbi:MULTISPECIES: DUF2809 domain-containing protein [Desulfitobacterium]|uniref:DUF2809 domain-containing protein n=2 Tax=Desulfitobacterium dehalogenans TaxID=36854 RepID=I4A6Z2_DESDJ|nr:MULTISPECIES: DUF2809 domain-containing protein [Desulfitobacterium]AFL99726.1 Protein of unknown function (DUF2809) [Desulfitobacterium dehalogenans ATCC 51507]HHY28981.1 DUF2809 domain-containing protein [Desulfitobacterium dehalogenans]